MPGLVIAEGAKTTTILFHSYEVVVRITDPRLYCQKVDDEW